MTRYYTLNPLAFWNSDAGTVPAGATEISDTDLANLMQGQTKGQQIVLKNNIPTLITISIDSSTKVPQQVSMYQAQRLLYETPDPNGGNLYDATIAYINQADFATQLAWNKATIITRDSPLMSQIATNFGLSDTDVDQMFIAAAQITA